MANHASPVKAARQALRHRERNKKYQSMMKTALKKIRLSTQKSDGESLLRTTAKLLDELTAKGIIHQNNAANKKSKLAKFVQTLP